MTTVKRILIKARVYPRPQFILSFLPSLVPQNVLCILILKYGAAMTQSTEFIFRTFFIADASRLSRLSHSLTDKNLGIHCKWEFTPPQVIQHPFKKSLKLMNE